ncbi:MAG: cell division protein ZapA [Tannerella sp.]|jgi:cell division protein ZapA (FtsZ GTPase activity inhibitor)|nr:cell division protein ZapA [Tannerella sp.]
MYRTVKRIVVKKDEFNINLEVAGRTYPVTITRGDEFSEATIRKAAERIQMLYAKYRQQYVKTLDDRDLLGMVALQLVTDLIWLEEKYDTTPLTQKIRQYITELDGFLPGN